MGAENRFWETTPLMPFTLAHPAAIYPLRHVRYLASIPLVVGSMTPDAVGFLFPHAMAYSHTVKGTLVADLAMGYGLLVLLMLLQAPLTVLLWEPHRSFLRQAWSRYFLTSANWLVALPSLLIGSWTHIVWDSFTHPGRWGVRHIPVLQQPIWLINEHPMEISHLLQYVCSVVGLAVVVMWYLRSLRDSGFRHEPGGRWRKLLLSCLVTLSVLAGTTAAASLPVTSVGTVYRAASITSIVAMATFAVTYVLAGIITTACLTVRAWWASKKV